jgi:hypothetical protein
MENSVKYLNQRIQKQMSFLADDIRSGPSVVRSRLKLYEGRNEGELTEEGIYDNLARLIVWSINPFSITDVECLESAIDAYHEIIPLIGERDIKDLANHCLASTESNLANLEKISMVKRLNEKIKF